MWALIKVNESEDIGKNEIRRIIISNNPSIVNSVGRIGFSGTGMEVHPATQPEPKKVEVLVENIVVKCIMCGVKSARLMTNGTLICKGCGTQILKPWSKNDTRELQWAGKVL